MVASVQQIIGKVNPRLYAANGKELLKKYKNSDNIPAEEVEPKSISEHHLGYNSSSETLEPLYFFILDLMNDFGLAPEKYIDNFTSTPGSGHFQELGLRATSMQQQASNTLATVNTILKSILNITYDLRDFKIRLEHYDYLKSKKKETQEASVLALKQIWLDKVDIVKGNSSIKAMALGQAGFQTLLDAFLIVKNQKDIDKIDLNDRIKRILRPRIMEFESWLNQSEQELRRRYALERAYLKSQVNSLKLYSRWAKPYLKAASQLEMKESGREPALVKIFNTMLLELTLLGKSKLKIRDSALEGDLPQDFSKESFLKTIKRNYYTCILVDFTFRGIPSRLPSQQSHYVFGGKADVMFRAYSLNDDEIKKINQEMNDSDLGDVLKLIEGSTTESLEQLQEEINYFLEEQEQINKPEKSSDTSNPFLALIGHYDKPEKKEKLKESKEIIVKKDDWTESELLRPLAAKKAEKIAFDLFDIYKKAHGMASFT
ncbi:MAG: hypothetical protein KKF48_01700 [Nanoarchaeota archaeon]|nr:hypothetical protein [Nanoarchaeota archaeon]MBU1027735.1 hypothetical protein [Nanoarchaeota archaeon]